MAEIYSGPQAANWNVYAGDANRVVFELSTSVDPVDLTGATIDAQARVSAVDQTIALTATVTEVEPLLGRFAVGWDGEAVRALLAGAEKWEGVWDVQILQAGQTLPRTILRGRFIATHDVTRTTP
jgi:hypothetical protein